MGDIDNIKFCPKNKHVTNLEQYKAIGRLPRTQARLHGPSMPVLVHVVCIILPELVQVALQVR